MIALVEFLREGADLLTTKNVIASIVEEVIKHLPTKHNQKTHGVKFFESTEPVTKKKIVEFLQKYAKGMPLDIIQYRAKILYEEIGMKFKTYREKMSAIISAPASELEQFGGVAEVRRIAQSVQDSLGYTKTSAHGLCTAASTLLWLRLGKPSNMMPARFSVNGEWHAALYDQKSGIVIDPTASQFEVGRKKVTLRVFTLNKSSPYKFKRMLSSRYVKDIIVGELASPLFKKGIVLREEKSTHYIDRIEDYAPGILSESVLNELSEAIDALTELDGSF